MCKCAIVSVRSRTDAHMHHKFAVVDGKVLLSGSFNYTRAAVLENRENVVVHRSRRLVQQFLKEFERLWADFGQNQVKGAGDRV